MSTPTVPPSAFFGKWRAKTKWMTLTELIQLFLPCYRWIHTYKWREYLQADLMAGITVGVMLVPQSMSYAKLAGLHPIYGLCQLAIGPVALASLLVSNVLSNIVDSSEQLYTELAILLALMVGVLECIMGLWMAYSIHQPFCDIWVTTASAIVLGCLTQIISWL